MASRLDLHEVLASILGNRNVYFQPPENLKLSYPCIIYSLSKKQKKNANNKPYKKDKAYKVTLIHSDPDNEIADILDDLPYSKLNTHFTSAGKHHYVYELYF